MPCTCGQCDCTESYAFKKNKIECVGLDNDSKKLEFFVSDANGGPYTVTYGDLRTNCTGEGSGQEATPWNQWGVGTIGTLNLSHPFCSDFGIPYADPKHPPGYGLDFMPKMRHTDREWTETYDVEVIGVRVAARYKLNLRVVHLINPFDDRLVKSFDFDLAQHSSGALELDDDYLRKVIAPDHPGVDIRTLQRSDVSLHWVTVLLQTDDGRRVDVALHDESMVHSHTIARIAPKETGTVTLTQLGWSTWNLPNLPERALVLVERMASALPSTQPKDAQGALRRGSGEDPNTILESLRRLVERQSKR